jgi:undecaprenyl-phosphate 4-deoxy-4-formamido-L-arabinose transferase
MKPTLTIVVPLYNSMETIERLVAELTRLTVPGGHELILVNDGSRDSTCEVAERLIAQTDFPVTLVKLARNFGEHNAVMAGFHEAKGDYVINLDDDLQNPPSEVLKLLDFARANKFEVVYSYYEEKQHASWRNWGSWLTNRVADLLLDKPKGLYLSSFRCVTAFVVKEICKYDGPFVYVDGLILQVTQNIGRLQVAHAGRESGRSGYTLGKLIKLWLSMFVNFSTMPLHMATMLGFALAGIGFLYTVSVFVEHYVFGTPAGWGSLMAALLVFCGAQLILLGLVGEYLGRLYLTANKKPQFVVKQIVRKSNFGSNLPGNPAFPVDRDAGKQDNAI